MIGDEDSARAWVRSLPECDAQAWARLERLIELLVEENTRQNLVAKATLPQVWQRHIVDSAQLLTCVPRETIGPWLDLGTGAGFPGIVVACLRPELAVVMVESRTRRVEWLRRLCLELELTQGRVIGSRLETIDAFAADVISARAFAPLSSLLEISARFSTSATLWLLPKGRSAAQELRELRGWDHAFHVEQSLTDTDAGIVVGTLAGRKGAKP
jgi:16S rRNA (guanine527-N7)-methyltransferase